MREQYFIVSETLTVSIFTYVLFPFVQGKHTFSEKHLIVHHNSSNVNVKDPNTLLETN